MNGHEMEAIREQNGLRQREVAAELGVSNETICRWEQSGRELTRMAEGAFLRLIGDTELVKKIKDSRRVERLRRKFDRLAEADKVPAVSPEVPQEGDAAGPEVEQVRRVLREKFRQIGMTRGSKDLSERSGVEVGRLGGFVAGYGLRESELKAILEVLREAEGM